MRLSAWLLALAMVLPGTAQDLDLLPGLPGAPAEGPTPSETPPPADQPPAATALLTLNGSWVLPRGGYTEYLEVFGSSRFIYRDSRGGAAAGSVKPHGNWVELSQDGLRRAFAYELGPNTLRLTPDSTDQPVDRSDLGRMSPRGVASVVFRRRGTEHDEELIQLHSAADLVGSWQRSPVPLRTETLELTVDRQFHYRGPAGLSADGEYVLTEDRLSLTTGLVTRRLTVGLALDQTGWTLRLTLDPAEDARPLNDLYDLAPRFSPSVVWTRPLQELTLAELTGRYSYTTGEGAQRLMLLGGGQGRFARGDSFLVDLTYHLEGTKLVLLAEPRPGDREVRRFIVQPLFDGLVLARDENDRPRPGGLLEQLPPTTSAYARYQGGG